MEIQDLSPKPIIRTIIVQEKNNNEITTLQRTIYHWKNQENVTLQHPIQIAPEKFCQKVVDIVKQYNVSRPVIPVTNNSIPELNKYLTNAASDLENHFIFFNTQYTLQKEHPFLAFIIGHELAHRDHNTAEDRLIVSKNDTSMVWQRNTSLLLAIFGFFGPKSVTNVFVQYALDIYYCLLMGAAVHFMFVPHESIKNHKQMELDCDTDAIMQLKGNTHRKILVAREGINCFEYNKKTESFFQKFERFLATFVNDFNKPHPSYEERIKNLESIIKQLQQNRDTYSLEQQPSTRYNKMCEE